MNVNSANVLSFTSSLVGIPQQTATKKLDDNGLKETEQITETEDTEESQSAKNKEQDVKSTPQKYDSTTKQQSQSIQRRFFKEDTGDKKVFSDKAQSPQDTDIQQAGQSKIRLDTSSWIQLKSKQNLNELVQNREDGASVKQEFHKKQLLNNMKKMVDIEYKQYVKDNDPLYTRRNLREILQALGDQDSPKTRKTWSERDKNSVGKEVKCSSNYNRLNISKMANTMYMLDQSMLDMGSQLDYDLVA